MGDLRIGDGVDHHRAVLDDPALLVLLADHVAGGVVQEEEGDVALVGELDELGGLLGLGAEQHSLGVGQDADGIAVEGCPAGRQARPVEGLELVEVGAVDHTGDDLARVEGVSEVAGDDPQELVLVVLGGSAGPGSPNALRWLSRATTRLAWRRASCSSTAK